MEKIVIVNLICLLMLSCSESVVENEFKKNDSLTVDILKNSNDVANISDASSINISLCEKLDIKHIDMLVSDCNKNITVFRELKKNIFDLSSEGGDAIFYYSKDSIKKVHCTFYGETGKSVFEYYINNNKVFFVSIEKYEYKLPIVNKKNIVKGKSKDLIYFVNSNICKIIRNDEIVNDDDSFFINTQKEIMDIYLKISK